MTPTRRGLQKVAFPFNQRDRLILPGVSKAVSREVGLLSGAVGAVLAATFGLLAIFLVGLFGWGMWEARELKASDWVLAEMGERGYQRG